MTKTMTAIALYTRTALKFRQMVTVHGWDERSLYVEWPDGSRSWSPRFIFQNGYDQFACVSL
jgi:hypothetical protein